MILDEVVGHEGNRNIEQKRPARHCQQPPRYFLPQPGEQLDEQQVARNPERIEVEQRQRRPCQPTAEVGGGGHAPVYPAEVRGHFQRVERAAHQHHARQPAPGKLVQQQRRGRVAGRVDYEATEVVAELEGREEWQAAGES